MTLIQCKGEGRFVERAKEELFTLIYDYGCLRLCDLIHLVEDSLINDNRQNLSEIKEFCAERIKVAVSKNGEKLPKIEQDSFATSCITEEVKTVVFDGIGDRSSEVVTAGR